MPSKKRVLVDVVEAGRKGGEQRRENLSPEERTESARAAANSRWGSMSEAEKKAYGAKLAAARAKKRAGVKKAAVKKKGGK